MIVVVEGDTDVPYVRKLAKEAGLEITSMVDATGKGNIDRDLVKYNSIAKTMPLLVLRDLDHDAPCPGEFLAKSKLTPSRWFRFRLAVRELESWILADAPGLSKFIGVEERWLPSAPDSEQDPTRALLKIVARSPGDVRRRLLPAKGSTTIVGPLYETTLIEFGEHHWSVARASRRSPSLKRAREALRTLAREWAAYVDPGAAS